MVSCKHTNSTDRIDCRLVNERPSHPDEISTDKNEVASVCDPLKCHDIQLN